MILNILLNICILIEKHLQILESNNMIAKLFVIKQKHLSMQTHTYIYFNIHTYLWYCDSV